MGRHRLRVPSLERGYASAPLRVYVEVAVAFEVSPGRLLGSEELERPVGEGEMTLVALTRRLGLAPDEAIARIVGAADGGAGPPP